MPPPGPARHPAGPAKKVSPPAKQRYISVAPVTDPLADIPESTKTQLRKLRDTYSISLDRGPSTLTDFLERLSAKISSIPDSELVATLLACDYWNQTQRWDFMTPTPENNISQLPALQQTLVQQTIGAQREPISDEQHAKIQALADAGQIEEMQKLLDIQEAETRPSLVSRADVKYVTSMCGWYALYFAQVFEQTELESPDRLERLNRRVEFEKILQNPILNNIDAEEIKRQMARLGLHFTIVWQRIFSKYENFKKYVTAQENQQECQYANKFKSGEANTKFIFILFIPPPPSKDASIGHWITVCAERGRTGHIVMTIADSYNEDHRQQLEVVNWYRYLSEPE
jgi:hypothetical protein